VLVTKKAKIFQDKTKKGVTGQLWGRVQWLAAGDTSQKGMDIEQRRGRYDGRKKEIER
jgi:hypothetical protein